MVFDDNHIELLNDRISSFDQKKNYKNIDKKEYVINKDLEEFNKKYEKDLYCSDSFFIKSIKNDKKDKKDKVIGDIENYNIFKDENDSDIDCSQNLQQSFDTQLCDSENIIENNLIEVEKIDHIFSGTEF